MSSYGLNSRSYTYLSGNQHEFDVNTVRLAVTGKRACRVASTPRRPIRPRVTPFRPLPHPSNHTRRTSSLFFQSYDYYSSVPSQARRWRRRS